MLLSFICVGFCTPIFSQQAAAILKGRITDDQSTTPIEGVVISLQEKIIGNTDAKGNFSIPFPNSKLTKISFSRQGYKTLHKTYYINKGQTRTVAIELKTEVKVLKDVVINANKAQAASSMTTINTKLAKFNPSIVGGVEGLIKTYVGSNNELTSQYNVRGGSYDDNLVYVNDYEIYRPFLVQNGQAEGLSFINSDLVSNLSFSTGGFQAKYGDKMSSALDVKYKRPDTAGGSAYLGLIEQGIHLEGISKNKKFTYLLGARNRNTQNVVEKQPTQGAYNPNSSDIQLFLSYETSKKWRWELLGNYNQTRFNYYPKSESITIAALTPIYASEYTVNFNFEGREKDRYATNFVGLTAINQVNDNLQLKWMASHYGDRETQNTDITASYAFGSSTSSLIDDTLSYGNNINYSRNSLAIDLWTLQHRGSYHNGNNFFQWGILGEVQTINSNINQWEYRDSAGYSTSSSNAFTLYDRMYNKDKFSFVRTSGFFQDNIAWGKYSDWSLQAGVRYNYNTLNKEFLISPRMGIAYHPSHWKRDIVFRAAGGSYNQPPFFREMLTYNGSINKDLKAQKSWQGVLGMDYNFHMMSRPARFTVESYYKSMRDVDPYDMDNVRIRYYGNNNAKAYAAGIEARLFGQLVKDAESWITIGYMTTKEKIDGLTYTNYYNSAGQIINQHTTDKVVADSSVSQVGWLRRPTDRRLMLGMFFQDYLTTNKNCKVFLNTVYGSNLPYNVPNSTRYRNSLEIDPYFRMDVGFTMLLVDGKKVKRSYSPFHKIKDIWAGIDIFNILDRSNVISYTLIKDYNNTIYALPNRLTPRLLNFKIAVSW